ncbi:MAG: hypothetical protein ACE5DM_01875 [Candidatus Nanoarchaeia archaeon]
MVQNKFCKSLVKRFFATLSTVWSSRKHPLAIIIYACKYIIAPLTSSGWFLNASATDLCSACTQQVLSDLKSADRLSLKHRRMVLSPGGEFQPSLQLSQILI